VTLCALVGYIYHCCKSNNPKVNPVLFGVGLIMEFFTLSEDLDEIRHAKSILRNRIIGILVVVAAFLSLRGFDSITIEYNKAYFKGSHQISKDFTETFYVGDNARGNINSTSAKLTTDDKDFYSKWGFRRKSDDSMPDDRTLLVRTIKEKLVKEASLEKRFEFSAVRVDKINMSGGYWFPLIKNGKFFYRVSLDNRFYKDTYSATFTGEIDLGICGVCSLGELKRIIADKIADVVVKAIKEDYKK
jgi:hypothetical protein